jgi:predicted transcriptional regulator
MKKENNISIIFRPENDGLEKFYGKLESRLLELIWANGPMTVKRALYLINRKSEKTKPFSRRRDSIETETKYAYTTIMTVLNRLCLRKILTREKEGHSFMYSPALGKDEFIRFATGQIIGSLMDDFEKPTVKSFHKARKALGKPK